MLEACVVNPKNIILTVYSLSIKMLTCPVNLLKLGQVISLK